MHVSTERTGNPEPSLPPDVDDAVPPVPYPEFPPTGTHPAWLGCGKQVGTVDVVVFKTAVRAVGEPRTRDRRYRVHHTLVRKRFPPHLVDCNDAVELDPAISHPGSVWRAYQTDSNANLLQSGAGVIPVVVAVAVQKHHCCSKNKTTRGLVLEWNRKLLP